MTTSPETRWLEERRSSIGASDSAAILGVSPFATELDIHASKVLPVEKREESEHLKWGRRLEGVIAAGYAEDTGRRILDPGPYTIKRRDFDGVPLSCTLDYQQYAGPVSGDPKDNPPGVLEIKNTAGFMDHNWNEGIPLYYEIQIQHQMAVMDWGWGTVCVLVGGSKLHYHDVEPNGEFVRKLMAACARFWRCVEAREEPAPTARDKRPLELLHPDDSGDVIALPPEAEELILAKDEAKGDIKAREDDKALIENKLRALLGNATFGELPNGMRASWKNQKTKGYTVVHKERTNRILRTHIPKALR